MMVCWGSAWRGIVSQEGQQMGCPSYKGAGTIMADLDASDSLSSLSWVYAFQVDCFAWRP